MSTTTTTTVVVVVFVVSIALSQPCLFFALGLVKILRTGSKSVRICDDGDDNDESIVFFIVQVQERHEVM